MAFFISCAAIHPTQPNVPHAGPFPAIFDDLKKQNPLLAKELAKLPEFQDGLSDSEQRAIGQLAALYHENPEAFDGAFNLMFQFGQSKIRKYCSPLQALFWLAEDGKLNQNPNILVDYRLDKLLDDAWQVRYLKPGLTAEQIRKVIDETDNQNIKGQLTQSFDKSNPAEAVDAIFISYQINPNYFSQPAQKIILRSLRVKNTSDPRWTDFDRVVERLNAPELIDYYQKQNFQYRLYGSSPLRDGPSASPDFIFKKKAGNCKAYASFTLYCLKRSGYQAWTESMIDKNHITTLFKFKDGIYILDNAWFHRFNSGLKGPYRNKKDALNIF